MHFIVRAVAAVLVAIVVRSFLLFMPFAMLPGMSRAPGLASVLALLSGVAAGWFVWRGSSPAHRRVERAPGERPLRYVLRSALLLGAIGFAGGFFGPIVFAPEANQGPLLGIFVTGPLGVMIGAAVGAIRWSLRHRGADPRGNLG